MYAKANKYDIRSWVFSVLALREEEKLLEYGSPNRFSLQKTLIIS
jgi:hypothetical protein